MSLDSLVLVARPVRGLNRAGSDGYSTSPRNPALGLAWDRWREAGQQPVIRQRGARPWPRRVHPPGSSARWS